MIIITKNMEPLTRMDTHFIFSWLPVMSWFNRLNLYSLHGIKDKGIHNSVSLDL